MNIKIVRNGMLDENCYILEKDGKYLIIDPGSEFERIKENIHGEVLGVLITHRHFDHIGALDEVLNEYHPKIFDRSITEETTYFLGPFKFNVIFNPGHTPDSITFYFFNEEKMFVGDFIFNGNIGRCDLEGGDMKEMMKSIAKIKKYKDNITIYPGHGEFTKLGHEKIRNNYINI